MMDPTPLLSVAQSPPLDGPTLLSFGEALQQFLRPETLADVLVDGLAKSALYVMIAAGLTLIFGLMGVLNFAHGSLTMMGAYLGGLLLIVLVGNITGTAERLALFFVVTAIVLAALALLGGAIEVTLIRPLYERPPLSQILLTFGLTLVLDEMMRIVLLFYDIQPIADWQEALGTKPALLVTQHDVTAPIVLGFAGVTLPVTAADVGVGGAAAVAAWGLLTWYDDGVEWLTTTAAERDVDRSTLRAALTAAAAVGGAVVVHALVAVTGFGPIRASGLTLFEILAGVASVAAIWAFLTRTRYGLYVRAGSEDSEMAEALGIDVRRVFTVVFALGTGIAGVAGMLLMWDTAWGASVPLASETLLPAFVVVIVGGLGTFRGTVVAAIIVGMTDAVMTWWFINEVQFTGLPELTIFLILVGVLVLRPQGLFGAEEVGGH